MRCLLLASTDCNGDPLYVDGVITMFPEATTIASGDAIAVINLPLDYAVQFDINPSAAAGGWGRRVYGLVVHQGTVMVGLIVWRGFVGYACVRLEVG